MEILARAYYLATYMIWFIAIPCCLLFLIATPFAWVLTGKSPFMYFIGKMDEYEEFQRAIGKAVLKEYCK